MGRPNAPAVSAALRPLVLPAARTELARSTPGMPGATGTACSHACQQGMLGAPGLAAPAQQAARLGCTTGAPRRKARQA